MAKEPILPKTLVWRRKTSLEIRKEALEGIILPFIGEFPPGFGSMSLILDKGEYYVGEEAVVSGKVSLGGLGLPSHVTVLVTEVEGNVVYYKAEADTWPIVGEYKVKVPLLAKGRFRIEAVARTAIGTLVAQSGHVYIDASGPRIKLASIEYDETTKHPGEHIDYIVSVNNEGPAVSMEVYCGLNLPNVYWQGAAGIAHARQVTTFYTAAYIPENISPGIYGVGYRIVAVYPDAIPRKVKVDEGVLKDQITVVAKPPPEPLKGGFTFEIVNPPKSEGLSPEAWGVNWHPAGTEDWYLPKYWYEGRWYIDERWLLLGEVPAFVEIPLGQGQFRIFLLYEKATGEQYHVKYDVAAAVSDGRAYSYDFVTKSVRDIGPAYITKYYT